MPKVIKLKKGLDISLVGEALSELNELPLQREYALVPDNFRGRRPENAGQGGRGGEGRNAAVFR